MAQCKTKAIVIESPKKQTSGTSGPTLLPLPLKNKYKHFNSQSTYYSYIARYNKHDMDFGVYWE